MAVAVETEELLAAKFAALLPHLDERQQLLYLGSEARSLGHGGAGHCRRYTGARERPGPRCQTRHALRKAFAAQPDA